MSAAAIRVVGVKKHFGGIVVAEDINLEIAPGEILGLIGPNGAGKTTLFNLISGIHAPDGGEIYLRDQPLSRLAVYKRARLGIARTWQHVRLFPTLSVLDNVLMGPRDYPGKGQEAQAMKILERIGMAAARDKMPGALPFGQQKLVALARTLMNDGEVLLLDEPMAGVEGQVYETIKQVVRDEAKAGRAVCVVEHNVSFIRDLCTRAVFMFNGRIEQSGTVEELLASDKLAELYFGGMK
ncbi:MAG: ATP-binding cassette domain-containing protein [Candidatus Parcubacteria bacterium]|nr:ATP-binding cassette domain-containing protein [Burkholderiales bacterium]